MVIVIVYSWDQLDGFIILPVAERGQAGAGEEAAEAVRDGGHWRPAAAAGQE